MEEIFFLMCFHHAIISWTAANISFKSKKPRWKRGVLFLRLLPLRHPAPLRASICFTSAGSAKKTIPLFFVSVLLAAWRTTPASEHSQWKHAAGCCWTHRSDTVCLYVVALCPCYSPAPQLELNPAFWTARWRLSLSFGLTPWEEGDNPFFMQLVTCLYFCFSSEV